jgi:ribosomal protein S27E
MATNYVACPICGAADPMLLKFTWWGGALGPKMLTHVKCQNCGNKYNGKTGGANTAGVAIYMIVVGAISFALMFTVFFFLFSR